MVTLFKCPGLLDCKNKRTLLSHQCPYQTDINNDPDYKCKCCEDCQHNCAMDI